MWSMESGENRDPMEPLIRRQSGIGKRSLRVLTLMRRKYCQRGWDLRLINEIQELCVLKLKGTWSGT